MILQFFRLCFMDFNAAAGDAVASREPPGERMSLRKRQLDEYRNVSTPERVSPREGGNNRTNAISGSG